MAKAFLVKNREKRVLLGNPWIYKNDIETVNGSFEPGDIIDVYSLKNRFLGRGFINPNSQITIRLLTQEKEEINDDFFFKRLSSAWEYRKTIADPQSCRVVFGESDFLPGLVVDKYGDYLVIQTLALGMDRYKPLLVELLSNLMNPLGIYERNDVPVRELEGLPQQKGFLKNTFDTKIEMQENGIRFLVDIENGQKTGFFLDQKENRAAIKPFVSNAHVLDCFTYNGSFALHAATYGAASVTGIDVSKKAVERAIHNANLNSLGSICHFFATNTFHKLREYQEKQKNFDVVILDPPAFTKKKDSLEGAIRGYKEINLSAMKIIRKGGFLITCSCSHHLDSELFLDIIYDASIDARKKVRLLENRSQAKDHPVLLASKETHYLKCAILQVF